jgi:hypothetical protein
MEWAIVVFTAVMLGLYLWSHLTAGREISKKLQPFVDDLFGVAPSESDSIWSTKFQTEALPVSWRNIAP